MNFLTLWILAAALLTGSAAQATTLFDFEADTPGTATQFTDTVNGLSATFFSPADPGGFAIQPTIFATLTGNVLGDPGPSFQQNLALTVDFSSMLSAITLVFATADFGTPSPFRLDAYNGANLVGTASSAGIVPAGLIFPEGEIAFSGGNFNSVVFSSDAPTFAIDNVLVATAAQAPEPGTGAMLLSACACLAVSAIRRRTPR